jgi:hypothetical protein
MLIVSSKHSFARYETTERSLSASGVPRSFLVSFERECVTVAPAKGSNRAKGR